VRFEYGVGVVGTQQCERCGANWRYHWEERIPGRGRRIALRILLVVVVVAMVVGVVALASSREPDHPAAWNTRVRPIAEQVEALRGLRFEHPVKVNFLTPSEFASRRRATAGEREEPDARMARIETRMRTMGLLGADVDLTRVPDPSRPTDASALYDADTGQLYVRGTGPLTVDRRVALAHELTHVLQDQHFDLGKLRGRARGSDAGSVAALDALVEGDATRIEERFLAGLSQAERDEYALRALAAPADDPERRATDPEVVRASFGAPAVFGPPIVAAISAGGGNASVDEAFAGPPSSTRLYFDPGAVGNAASVPPAPELFPGEKRLPALADGDDHFETFDLYLMLAAKLDVATALRAADAFSTGSRIDYTRGGRTCFRAALDGVTRGSSNYLAEVLRRWATAMPQAEVSFTATGVLLRSCDPGADATTPDDARIRQAVRLAAGRDELIASLAQRGLPTKLAVCAARVLVDQQEFRAAILGGAGFGEPTPTMVQASQEAGRACRANPRAGVPERSGPA
jgi:hypothetical protein